MARDIEEFLRKAAERRAAQQKGQRPAAQPSAAKPSMDRPAPASQRPPQVTRPSVESEDEPEPFPSGQSVAEHVQKHIDAGASEISQQTRKLGERVGQAGKKVRERVQQKFDHEVGNLVESQAKSESTQTKKAAARPGTPALVIAPRTIAELLRSPQALRQSIIVAELLKRPEWD